MVLVCNEWLKNNVDEDQTSSSLSPTPASGAVGSTALNRTGTTDTATELPQTTRYPSGEEPAVKPEEAQYALNMETEKVSDHIRYTHICKCIHTYIHTYRMNLHLIQKYVRSIAMFSRIIVNKKLCH